MEALSERTQTAVCLTVCVGAVFVPQNYDRHGRLRDGEGCLRAQL